MAVNSKAYQEIRKELDEKNITLVAVSKTKPAADILELYNLGHRDFGENYVQELVDKAASLPKDIKWHFIGHLQSNKVKFIAPFVQLIHGVDSLKLLQEINKQAARNGRVIDCLLQVHIAQEETKFGLDENELSDLLSELDKEPLPNVRVAGLMGMASFTEDLITVREEFRNLKRLFDKQGPLTRHSGRREGHHTPVIQSEAKDTVLSMGMSADYRIAIEEGSTMVRIGSLLFGERANS